jgi:hypothetical protein
MLLPDRMYVAREAISANLQGGFQFPHRFDNGNMRGHGVRLFPSLRMQTDQMVVGLGEIGHNRVQPLRSKGRSGS